MSEFGLSEEEIKAVRASDPRIDALMRQRDEEKLAAEIELAVLKQRLGLAATPAPAANPPEAVQTEPVAGKSPNTAEAESKANSQTATYTSETSQTATPGESHSTAKGSPETHKTATHKPEHHRSEPIITPPPTSSVSATVVDNASPTSAEKAENLASHQTAEKAENAAGNYPTMAETDKKPDMAKSAGPTEAELDQLIAQLEDNPPAPPVAQLDPSHELPTPHTTTPLPGPNESGDGI